MLDMAHAEVLPPGGADAQTTTATPIYEYWWTRGHGSTKPSIITSSRVGSRLISGTGWRTLRPGSTSTSRSALVGGFRKSPPASSTGAGGASGGLDPEGSSRVAAIAADRRRCWPSGLGTRPGTRHWHLFGRRRGALLGCFQGSVWNRAADLKACARRSEFPGRTGPHVIVAGSGFTIEAPNLAMPMRSVSSSAEV